MMNWKRMIILVLMVVLFLSQMLQGATDSPNIHYNFQFNGGISYRYTMKLPNTTESTPEGHIVTYSGKNVTIGTAAIRPYPIRGEYIVWLSDTSYWNERWDIPYFRIDGIVSPVYRVYPGNNPFGSYQAKGTFEIPANQIATVTYNAGHYVSKFLGFLWITNQWGIGGGCSITLYLDADAPDPPRDIRCNGELGNQFTTNGTVTLSWETPEDKPKEPRDLSKDFYKASGIKGYKIFDGENDITPPGSKYFSGNSQEITLQGEGVHEIKLLAYDNEENPSKPVKIYITVDQTPPTGNLNIISNNGFINNRNVTLSLTNLSDGSKGTGLAAVCFSNDNVTYGDWEPWTQSSLTKPWTLNAGDGVKTVYLKLKDNLGNETENPISATVTLDTTPPTGSITINTGAGATTSRQVELTLAAEDSGTGVAGMMFSNDGVHFSMTESFNTLKHWILSDNQGMKTVHARFIDYAGNTTEAEIKDEINYEIPVFTGVTPTTELLTSETWTENQTIYGQLIVPAGVTLTIEPGVTVTIDGPGDSDPERNGLIIEGSLIAGSGVNFVTTKPGWMGIIISGTATLTGANISHARRGLAVLSAGTVTVTGCAFSQNFTGIHVHGSAPAITNCTFVGNTYGIKEDAIGAQRPAVNGCVFTANSTQYYHDPLTRITVEQLNQIPGNGNNQ